MIEANEKLIKLDSAKSYFLGLLSHELRTPLMGISGNAQYISEITQDAEIRECVNSIMLSESRLRRFAELSLLITQIKTDKYDTTFYDESVNQIMVNVLNNFQACIKLKNLTVENKLAKEFFTARLDLALISKVFTIIVENAIKFTPNDSKIIISSGKQGKHLVMSVEDQGTGFSTDSLKNAFSMFISTEDLMHHSEGTGLSLAAAKVIFDLHNFGIKVTNSESGSGKVIMTF